MKNQTATKIATLLLPLIVVYVAISPNSVTVIQDQQILYTTFAEAVSGSAVGWCAPVALLLTYALFGMAVIQLFAKKQAWLRWIRNLSFVAACLAACPILIQGQVTVIPNVLAAILLMVLWGVSYYALWSSRKENNSQPEGQRLSGR